MEPIKHRITHYWSHRAEGFEAQRLREFESEKKDRWLAEFRKYLPQGRALRVLDIGTGGGVPSVPLAVCTDCSVTANDATAKKLEFVRSVAEESGLANLSVLCGRAEELGRDPLCRESSIWSFRAASRA